MSSLKKIHNFLENLQGLDFVGLFLLRVYLFFVLWYAGIDKVDTVDKFSVKYTSYLNNHFRFLFIYQFQKIIFFLIPFLLLLVWFYKKKRIKKMMKLWEIEEQLEDLKEK